MPLFLLKFLSLVSILRIAKILMERVTKRVKPTLLLVMSKILKWQEHKSFPSTITIAKNKYLIYWVKLTEYSYLVDRCPLIEIINGPPTFK